MSRGIYYQLVEMAQSDGKGNAMKKAEKWREVLEDIISAGSRSEERVTMNLLSEINLAIAEINKMTNHPFPDDIDPRENPMDIIAAKLAFDEEEEDHEQQAREVNLVA